MPWNEPGGNQQDPWTGKKRGSGSKDSIEDILGKLSDKVDSLFGAGRGNGQRPDEGNHHGGNKGLILLAVVMVVGWLLSGFYTVDSRQRALVLRFGAYQTSQGAGLQWHLPYPIETVEIVDVEQNRTTSNRSTMLTKDENIVDIRVDVQYKIKNVEAFTFQQAAPQEALEQVIRGATREVVGHSTMDMIITEERERIPVDIQTLAQTVLDRYGAGIQILQVNLMEATAPPEVKDAFDDAIRAREDAPRYQNEAETYAKKVVPEARGRAAHLKEEANAYLAEAVARAEGDAARFSQLVAEYRKAPEVTRERLYLETMESVLSGSRKVLIDAKNGNNLILPSDPSAAPAPLNAAPPAATASVVAAQPPAAPDANTAPAAVQNNNGSEAPRPARTLTPGAPREGR